MTEPDRDPAPPESPLPEPALELVSRLNVLEGRVRNLEDRLEDVRRGEMARKQRALLWRLVLLAALLAGYFVLRAFRG